MSTAPVPGQLIASAAKASLLRFPLPPSLPIPLGVAVPEEVRLVTWAFAGLGALSAEGDAGSAEARATEPGPRDGAAGPVCLLALAAALPLAGETLTVATHFRDIAVRLEPTSAEALSATERDLLARALLSAGATALAPLGDLFGLVGPAVAALPMADDAPDLAAEEGGWTLRGGAIPHGLLFRTGSGWGCARVVSSRLGFAGGPRQQLAVAPLWGAAPVGRPDRAIALHAHGFTPLATRTA